MLWLVRTALSLVHLQTFLWGGKKKKVCVKLFCDLYSITIIDAEGTFHKCDEFMNFNPHLKVQHSLSPAVGMLSESFSSYSASFFFHFSFLSVPHREPSPFPSHVFLIYVICKDLWKLELTLTCSCLLGFTVYWLVSNFKAMPKDRLSYSQTMLRVKQLCRHQVSRHGWGFRMNFHALSFE